MFTMLAMKHEILKWVSRILTTRPDLTSYHQSQAIPTMAVVAESEVGHKAK